MKRLDFWKIRHIIIALVWLINGLFCKILNLVPRHELIVGRILGTIYAVEIAKFIGILELCMVVWIISRIQSKWCGIAQITLVLVMNIIETTLAPDLLLWGYGNICFAFGFALFLYFHTFIWKKN